MSSIPEHIERFLYDEMMEALYITTAVGYDTNVSDIPRKNMCDVVSNEFAVLVESEFEYTIKSPIKAPIDGAKHFVAVVTSTPDSVIDTPIVVDGTATQFDETNPEILVQPIESPLVEEIYDTIDL